MVVKRCALGLAALVVILSAMTACSSDNDAATNTPGSSAPTVPGAGTGLDAARLEALLITDVPGGYTVLADDVGDTGPSDLAKAIKDDGAADAEQQLAAEGFVAGYQRAWSNSSDDRLLIDLYEYREASGAAAWYARYLVSARKAQPPGTIDLTVSFPGSDQGAGFSGTAQGTTFVPLVAQVGTFVVRVTSYGSEEVDHQALATPIMDDQISRVT